MVRAADESLLLLLPADIGGPPMNQRNLWEEIRDGAREGLEVFREEMIKLTHEFERHGRLIKRKMDLSAIQRKVHLGFSLLGSRFYELIEEGKEKGVVTDPEIVKIISDIKGYKAEVEAIEAEIERIREEGSDTARREASGTGKKSSTAGKSRRPK
jgi:hypothetical protein